MLFLSVYFSAFLYCSFFFFPLGCLVVSGLFLCRYFVLCIHILWFHLLTLYFDRYYGLRLLFVEDFLVCQYTAGHDTHFPLVFCRYFGLRLAFARFCVLRLPFGRYFRLDILRHFAVVFPCLGLRLYFGRFLGGPGPYFASVLY